MSSYTACRLWIANIISRHISERVHGERDGVREKGGEKGREGKGREGCVRENRIDQSKRIPAGCGDISLENSNNWRLLSLQKCQQASTTQFKSFAQVNEPG